MDGKTIYAKSPTVRKYLIEDYKHLYKGADSAIIMGHSVHATRFNSFDENQHTETIAYSLWYPVCTMFFNKSKHKTENANSVHETKARVGTVSHTAYKTNYVMTIFVCMLLFCILLLKLNWLILKQSL